MSKQKKGTRTDDKSLKQLAKIFKSLSEPLRLEILRILIRDGETSVSAICEELGGESQPAISHHLTQLKNAELVDFKREGKFNFYFVSSEALSNLLAVFFPEHSKANQNFDFGNLGFTFRTKTTSKG